MPVRALIPHLKSASRFLLAMAALVLPAHLILNRSYAQPERVVRSDYAPPPRLDQDRVYRIVALGSSSTRGYGASAPSASYPSQLQRLFAQDAATGLPVEVVNRGVNGETISGMVERLDDDILPRRPAMVIWQLGSNDALQMMALDRFESELRRGIETIRATGSDVVLMNAQWSPRLSQIPAARAFSDAVLFIGQQMQVEVIDRYAIMERWMRDGTASAKELVGPDGLHMTDRGYALLARAVYAQIAPRVHRAAAVSAALPPGNAKPL